LTLSRIAHLRLKRVFLSANLRNIEVLRAIADHEVLRHNIVEIIWDDVRLIDHGPSPNLMMNGKILPAPKKFPGGSRTRTTSKLDGSGAETRKISHQFMFHGHITTSYYNSRKMSSSPKTTSRLSGSLYSGSPN
jgi:hypothetical protein